MSHSSSITIRFAEEKDVKLILDFIRQLAEYEKLAHEVIATEENLKKTLFGSKPFARVIFACIDHQEVGFALFFHNYSTFLGKPGIYIEDLFVKPEARGRGIGKVLLSYLAKLVQELECGRLEWWVLDWNQDAIKFYEKIGAQPMSEWTVFRVTGKSLEQLSKL